MIIKPPKLKAGDEVRVIASSSSLQIVSKEIVDHAVKVLSFLGLNVTFGKNAYEKDIFNSSSITSRLNDLHDAFEDKSVKAVFAALGGSSSNQLLKHIDYNIIKKNPKIFCGFSDITALQNAILHKADLITYSGPSFNLFGMKKGFDYSLDFIEKILFQNLPVISLASSELWSDDDWYLDQENRFFDKNDNFWVISDGKASGKIIGGNLSTFQLLHGTDYMPSLENSILFVEADSISLGGHVEEFNRDLQSIIHQPGFNKVQGLVIGRFEKRFGMNLEKLKFILDSKEELRNIPIIANVDFGHTMPIITFPIGGKCEIDTYSSASSINFIKP